MRNRSDDLTPTLPDCVRTALATAEDLYAAVIETPFPDLPAELTEAESAVDIVVDALRWAEVIDLMHGTVVELFPPREVGVDVEIVAPPSHLLGGHPTTLGGGFRRGYIPPRFPTTAYGETVMRTLRMETASDVLEPVPVRFRESLANVFPFCPGRMYADFDASRMRAMVAPEVHDAWRKDGWHGIRSRIVEGRMIVRGKSLGLVAWIRACADEMQSATLPEITWVRRRKYDGHVVKVSLAGAAHHVELTRGEHDFLANLANGTANASRATKSDLVKKIREIDPYVESLGTASPKTSRYSVPPAVAARICVRPTPTGLPTVSPTPRHEHKTLTNRDLGAERTN